MEYKKLPKDIAKKFQEAGKEENLTRSPDVNNLIRIAHALKEGKVKPEVLQEQLGILYRLHKNMADTVEFLSKTQPKTDVANERLPMIEEGLARFKESLDELNFYLEDGSLYHIEKGIEKLIEETNSLFESADVLKKDEEKIQIFSDSPMISELIRIGKGVAEGLYEPENLKKRLAFCKTFHQSAYENIKEVMNDAYDTKEAEEEAPLIMEALDLMEDGFEEIEMYFEDNDPEHIFEGTELVRQAAEELSSSYNILVSAVEEADKEAEQDTVPKEKICFKCGLKAQPDIKICPKCHIPIPDIKPIEEHPVEEPDVRIDVGEAKDMVTPMMTPNVKKIYDSAVAFMQKKISEEEFLSTLDWLDGLLRQSEETLKKEKLPDLTDERERQIMEQTKQIFEMGIKESKEGTAEMRLYLKDENPTHLQNGILQAIRGGEKLYQVQMLAKRIQQQAKDMKEKSGK
jgi:ribosomal protein L40E